MRLPVGKSFEVFPSFLFIFLHYHTKSYISLWLFSYMYVIVFCSNSPHHHPHHLQSPNPHSDLLHPFNSPPFCSEVTCVLLPCIFPSLPLSSGLPPFFFPSALFLNYTFKENMTLENLRAFERFLTRDQFCLF